MTTSIKKIPLELRGLWNAQYQPLEKHIFSILTKNGIDKATKKLIADYKNLSFVKKTIVLDKFATKLGL